MLKQSSVDHTVPDAVLLAIEGLGCSPLISSVKQMISLGDWDNLVKIKVDPADYSNAYDYWRDSQCVAFFSKNPDVPTTIDRRKTAVENWYKGEHSCYRSNQRLIEYRNLRFPTESESRVLSLITEARKAISSWIGYKPPDILEVEGRFGPGSTSTDPAVHSTIAHKMSSQPSLTVGCQGHLPIWVDTSWGRFASDTDACLDFVRGNRFTTVPKDATKDRAIGAEPSINIFYQLAYGRYLRRRLSRATGLDLDHLASKHVQIAREASNNGLHATIDLSNASDSVSKELVRLLLPRQWHERLSDLRSPYTFIDKKWVLLEKFSSMGNGYTFELETIIFLALCYATLKLNGVTNPVFLEDLTVFGDDIIVPTEHAASVIAVLKFFGMETNQRKTFTIGNFRESCGGDFFLGRAVRPHFLKGYPNEPQEWISLANGIRRSALQFESLYGLGCLHRAWLRCLDHLPINIRSCRGPEALGDIVVHDSEDRWVKRTRDCIRSIRVYRPASFHKVLFERFAPEVVLACATYGLGWNHGGINLRDGVNNTDSVLSYKVAWLPFS